MPSITLYLSSILTHIFNFPYFELIHSSLEQDIGIILSELDKYSESLHIFPSLIVLIGQSSKQH